MLWGDWLTIEHVPSGMTARADFGRSMVKMRDECRKIIRGKLWHLEHGAETTTATDAQRAIAERIMRERVAPAPGGMIHDESRTSGAVRQGEGEGA